jgi:hypothetical protein
MIGVAADMVVGTVALIVSGSEQFENAEFNRINPFHPHQPTPPARPKNEPYDVIPEPSLVIQAFAWDHE